MARTTRTAAWTFARATKRLKRSSILVREHPETGRPGLFGCAGYIIGFDGLDDSEGLPLLYELIQWQGREEFRYSHEWEPDMLIMWDNRSVLHRATGGYDGYDRLLHRTTIAAWDG